MDQEFSILKKTRKNLLSMIEPLSIDQLNKLPEGFNNNIIWNLAHILVTQQILCYKLSGLDMNVSEEFINKYRKGTKPEVPETQENIKTIKNKLMLSVEELEADYKGGKFKNFTPYPTSYGFELSNIADAIKFNNTHEALHLGYIMALKHIV